VQILKVFFTRTTRTLRRKGLTWKHNTQWLAL